jgi:glycosyltransferase involved in cell wall biosynthesis
VNGHSLWNVYAHADFVTFPSLYEGFGNAFLEAIYFKKPLLVNRYATFVSDIEPKGFDLVKMDGEVTAKTVQEVRAILDSPDKTAEMVNRNYQIAKKHYSYEVLRCLLNPIVDQLLGKMEFEEYPLISMNQQALSNLMIRPDVSQFFYMKN